MLRSFKNFCLITLIIFALTPHFASAFTPNPKSNPSAQEIQKLDPTNTEQAPGNVDTSTSFTIQVFTTQFQEKAEKIVHDLMKKGFKAYFVVHGQTKDLYKVRFGKYHNKHMALKALLSFQEKASEEFQDAFLIRYDKPKLNKPLGSKAKSASSTNLPHDGDKSNQPAGAKAVSASKSPADHTAIQARSWVEPMTGMEFVWVEGGCFEMGQTEGEKKHLIKSQGLKKYETFFSQELPLHRVCLKGFWMGKTEITREQFERFVRSTQYKTVAEKVGFAWVMNEKTEWKWKKSPGHDWTKAGYEQGADHPVVCIAWIDAKAYASWLSRKTDFTFRLPTEAEWEYAAKSGTTKRHPWGDDESKACLYTNARDKAHWDDSVFPCDDRFRFTSPVGRFQANDLGLHDLLGNVWEWCQDVYASDAYAHHTQKDPLVISGGNFRVVRGGSWHNPPECIRVANRFRALFNMAFCDIGFRVIRVADSTNNP